MLDTSAIYKSISLLHEKHTGYKTRNKRRKIFSGIKFWLSLLLTFLVI